MEEMMTKLFSYLQLPFVRYAVIVGVLIALCASLLGVNLVLKRFSFIGDGLSHVAFGAVAVAGVTGLTNNMLVVLPITVLSAILLLCTGSNAKIKGDAAVGMISVSALAVGYILMNQNKSLTNVSGDVCTTLFGSTSILTLTPTDVWMCALVIAVIIAVIIVVAMNLVGSLLISALVIFPALSAMRVFKSFRSVTVCAAVVSVVCALFGIIFSILVNTPVGATIVVVDMIAFAVFYVIGLMKGGAK